jgi:hypothetical protein
MFTSRPIVDDVRVLVNVKNMPNTAGLPLSIEAYHVDQHVRAKVEFMRVIGVVGRSATAPDSAANGAELTRGSAPPLPNVAIDIKTTLAATVPKV